MRPHEKITIDVKREGADFGESRPGWDTLCHVHSTIVHGGGRLVRSGDQLVASHDIEVTIRYDPKVYEAWQQKRTLRVRDVQGDEMGIKSMEIMKGRVWWLKMGCARG